MNKIQGFPRLRIGPLQIWGAATYRTKEIIFQTLGEGPNSDQYNGGLVALEGTNFDWRQVGAADEAAWLAILPPSLIWLPVEIPAGTPLIFDGTPSTRAVLATRFPRFIRLRETGTLAANHYIQFGLKVQ